MKYVITILAAAIVLLFSSASFAQFDVIKKVKKKVENEVKKEVFEEDKEKDNGESDEDENTPPEENKPVEYEENKSPSLDDKPSAELKVWSKYDFVAGDEIIFEDDLENEKHGEFPSKWDLKKGNAEIAVFGGENVIALQMNRTEIMPLMSSEEYLPEIFTLEFDIYYHTKYNEAYYLKFNNQKRMDIRQYKVSMGNFFGEPGEGAKDEGWHHIAISFNIRAMKVYFDQTRVLNIPNIKERPTSFVISALSHGAAKDDPAIIKNIRIAKGGVELYDKLITDGKIVTTGIRFDVNKASIKPESMGVINEIANLMNENPNIRLSVQGHTDSDGDDDSNQLLSEARAKSVKNALVELGIDESRLETKGFGEKNPVSDNTSPEGKAKNRRVEFVKL
ncbi:MAG: OmpA family protein [Ignavibacteria bacterium]|jgi:outer membrane protein OmpA-like peptidoglycan-associated protein